MESKDMPTELRIRLAKEKIPIVGPPVYILMAADRGVKIGGAIFWCGCRSPMLGRTEIRGIRYQCGHVYFAGACPLCGIVFWTCAPD